MSVTRDQPDYSRTIRPFWYDRYPTTIFLFGTLFNVAPHVPVRQWFYTVPAGRKAFVELLSANVLRQTVAAPAGIVADKVKLWPAGIPPGTVLQALIIGNLVGDKDRADLGHSLTLHAGDMIDSWTEDASTGGTCAHVIIMKAIEFDA